MHRASSIAIVAAAALVSMPALAQSQAKPPSINLPAAKPAPKTLGGKAPGAGKLLTRDELRSCMKRLDDIDAVGKEAQRQRAALDAEKEALTKSGEAIKLERADVEARMAAVREWETKMRAHTVQIEAFNKRVTAASQETDKSRSEREAVAKEIEAERERLGTSRAPLAEEEARVVPAYQTAVAAYNAKATARDTAVGEWNARNKALNALSVKHEDDRTAWLNACANRPYREEDEIAIKAGP